MELKYCLECGNKLKEVKIGSMTVLQCESCNYFYPKCDVMLVNPNYYKK